MASRLSKRPDDFQKWSKATWLKTRKYHVQDLSLAVCTKCRFVYYSGFGCERIEQPEEALELIELMQTLIAEMRDHGKDYCIDDVYKGYFQQLAEYQKRVDLAHKSLKDAINLDNYRQYPSIKEKSKWICLWHF